MNPGYQSGFSKGVFIILLTGLSFAAVTVENHIWNSLGMEKRLNSHITAEIEVQARFKENYRAEEKSFTEFSVQLRYWKHIHFTPGFRYGNDKNGRFYRSSVSAIYNLSMAYIRPSLRIKYQYEDGEQRSSKKTIRTKVTTGTSSHIPGTPYIYGEIFHLNTRTGLIPDKYRVGTGVKLRFNSHHSLKFYVIYEKEIAGDGDVDRIAGAKYEYRF